MLSNEKDMVAKLYYESLITAFAAKNARKVMFK